ncbi:MAG: methyltransferase [Kosmotogaceae bacterium]|nr:methyltransferase [Kosmotogaceae bacterium]
MRNEMIDLIRFLKTFGYLKDPRIEAAMMELDRADFVSSEVLDWAYDDRALLSFGTSGKVCSTSTQPSLLVTMIQELEMRDEDNVLDLGTGTGFCACILGKMAEKGSVITVEKNSEVASVASRNFERYRMKNLRLVIGDGRYGYEGNAPYDGIISTVAFSGMSEVLFSQMKIGGRCVSPIYRSYMDTPVFLFERTDDTTLKVSETTGAVFMVAEDSEPDPLYRKREFSLRLTNGRFQII